MKVCCLLTGRGNNTLKDKNILSVLGKPLITYPALQALKVISKEDCFVSSDDERILNSVEDFGFQPIKRPAEISGPDARHVDAIFHGCDYIQSVKGEDIDILVVMLANSATVKAEWISQGIEAIKEDDSITAVTPAYKEQDHHPYRAKKLDSDGNLVSYFNFGNEDVSTNRQELQSNYFLSHNFWVLNVKKSLLTSDGEKPWTFLGRKVKPIFVQDCFDVHNVNDISRTERWLIENGVGDEPI